MKTDLLEILACPVCKGDLELTAREMKLGHVIEGSLTHYTEDGTIWGISDGHTQLAEYLRLSKEQGNEVTVDQLLK